MPRRRTRFLSRLVIAAALGVAAGGCGSDGGMGPTLPDVARAISCRRGTIRFGTAVQTVTGTLSDRDCRREGKSGRVEVWAVPASWSDGATSMHIALTSEFDGVLVLFAEDGSVAAVRDREYATGTEMFVLTGPGAFYVGVEGFTEADEGAYTLQLTRYI